MPQLSRCSHRVCRGGKKKETTEGAPAAVFGHNRWVSGWRVVCCSELHQPCRGVSVCKARDLSCCTCAAVRLHVGALQTGPCLLQLTGCLPTYLLPPANLPCAAQDQAELASENDKLKFLKLMVSARGSLGGRCWGCCRWGCSRLLARALRRGHQDPLWLVCLQSALHLPALLLPTRRVAAQQPRHCSRQAARCPSPNLSSVPSLCLVWQPPGSYSSSSSWSRKKEEETASLQWKLQPGEPLEQECQQLQGRQGHW